MKKKNIGILPAIAIINPKFPHNLGGAVRAASCWGAKQVWFTGTRVSLTPTENYRLPREERMKGYSDVEIINDEKFFDKFENAIPIAIELKPNSESLTYFQHPDNALYVFGPEDGSIPSVTLRHCHRIVSIPTAHCLNLAAAINVVLSHRRVQRQLSGIEDTYNYDDYMKENRGFISNS